MVESRQAGILKVGDVQFPVRLMDESAGGFAVLTDRPPDVAVGQVVQLATDADWCHVHVTHVVPLEAAEQTGPTGGAFRLGLFRLGDVELPVERSFWRVFDGLRFPLHHKFASTGSIFVLGMLLALIVVLLPVRMLGGFQLGGGQSRNSDSPWSPLPSNAAGRPQENPPLAENTPTKSEPAARSSLRTLRNESHTLSGAAPLVLPDFVQALGLTTSQQKQIHKIVAASHEAVREIEAKSRRDELPAIRARVLDEARGQAMKVLNGEQRKNGRRSPSDYPRFLPCGNSPS